jgi:hypothetical protein
MKHLFDDVEPIKLPRVVIWDYDGTLSCGKHRLHALPTKDLHLVESWSEFNGLCVYDDPIQDNIDIMNAMYDAGLYVVILTGRSDEVRSESLKWLKDKGARFHMLEMRKKSDNRKDTIIKEEFLREKVGLKNIVAAWDDSPSVIAHFRSLGITTYQVVDYGDSQRSDLKSHGVEKL